VPIRGRILDSEGRPIAGAKIELASIWQGASGTLDAWLAARSTKLAAFSESWFYSDSLNDLPLLERVTHPVAVDPDPTLREHAGRKGWRIISLTDER